MLKSEVMRAAKLVVAMMAMVLIGCGAEGADTLPTSSPTVVPVTSTPAVSTRPSPKASTSPSMSPSISPYSDPSSGEPMPDGILTGLVLGTDSRNNDWGGLADTIVIVQISADRETLNLVSIARDTYVPIPGYGKSKINSAFGRGGIPLLKQTVSDLLGGLDIDFVVQSNFEGFIALTRAMDGFEVDNQHANTRTVGSTGRVVEFPEGTVELENTDGLIYVRERKALPRGDLDRTERARAALVGMMHRLVQITKEDPAQLPELLPMIYRNVNVDGDLDLEHLPTLIDWGKNFSDGLEIRSLMVPISRFGTVNGASVNILDESRTSELAAGLRMADLGTYVDKFGDSNAPTGN